MSIVSYKPKLIEPGVKYFLGETLSNCKKTKFEFTNRIINIFLLSGFIILFGLWLYYNYNEKKRKEDEKENEKKQQYILSLVHKYQQEEKEKEKINYKQQEMITDLPEFESEFEITMKKFL
jgi:hypothetical protein